MSFFHWLGPVATFLAAAWAVQGVFFGPARARDFKRRLLENLPILEPERLRQLVARFGANSNSFMTLYPGFEYFPESDGFVAFVDGASAWVAGAEPICPPEEMPTLLREFAAAAHGAGKSAIFVPVSEAVAKQARSQGYHALLMGSEATFDFSKYPRSGSSWLSIATAKSLDQKGARVREFSPLTTPSAEMKEMSEILTEWLDSRKSAELGFLNQVDPWLHLEQKKYFRVDFGGRCLAFVAAIPIPAKGGWYLIDLIRRQDTPPGSTELLLLHAMKLLSESGAKMATLGVAPLSRMEDVAQFEAAEPRFHARLYRLLHLIYGRGNFFYNFSPLFLFKQKFQPTSNEPAFLLYSRVNPSARFRFSDTLTVLRTFTPRGIARSATTGFLRMLARLSPSEWIKILLSNRTVVRSVPKTWGRLIYRCKFTTIASAVLLGIYLVTTDSHGVLYPELLSKWSYSSGLFRSNPLQSLALSPVLHWNQLHFDSNLLILVLFCGTLEYLAGSTITTLIYLAATLLSNPLSTLVFPLGDETDVGASLGIFGCAGALGWFLRPQYRVVLATLLLTTGISALVTHQWILLNHWVALGLGGICGALAFARK